MKNLILVAALLVSVTAGADPVSAPAVTPAAKVEAPAVVEKKVVEASKAPAAQTPKARMLEAIDKFLIVKPVEEGKTLTAAEKKANADAFKVLDNYLDWDEMTTYVLKPHLEKITKKEAARVRKLLAEAVRLVAYPAAGTFYSESDWKISGAKGNDVTTFAYFEDEDLEVESTFHFKKDRDVLKIWDLSVDGDSLAQDYRNSFGRIINKHGGAELVKRLEKALKQKQDAVKDMLP